MSDHLKDKGQALCEAVKSCDSNRLRNILDDIDEDSLRSIQWDENLLHLVSNAVTFTDSESNSVCNEIVEKGKDVIYMLIDAGFDTEMKDKCVNTCLFNAVKNNNACFCDVFLQCGADMWANTELNISIHEYVSQMSSEAIQATFRKYYPGLWKAVESEDIYQVRKLINLWCRTNPYMNGVALKDIALSTGNEEIISLILGIFDSMQLVYHILAKNVKAVGRLLETKRQRVRLDLRKMSDRGAPILYYLIQSEDISIIKLFIQHGCQLYSIMQDESGYDMPVLFSALKSDVSVSVIEALLPIGRPHQEEMLYKILYRGHTVLEVALQKNVPLEVFTVLINRGGPLLLCERNQVNQTVRDLAVSSGKTQYVNIIDMNIFAWIQYPWKYPGQRQKMALYGWNLELIEKGIKENVYVDEFFTNFKPLQTRMKCLSDAIEKGDFKMFMDLKASLSQIGVSENFLWHGRVVGDGMPLLHKAVLSNRLNVVEIILAEKPPEESIDNLFDQNRRTALHYAYASASTKAITNLLTSYGCSEHVLDKANREPLDFRDKQDSPVMIQLLSRLKSKDLSSPEVDPWTVKGTKDNLGISKSVSCCHQLKETYDIEKTQHSHPSDSDSLSELSEEEDNQEAKTCTII